MFPARSHIIRIVTPFIIAGTLLLASIHTCERFEPEAKLKVRTDSIITVFANAFAIEGAIVYMGESEIIQHGFCYAESGSPTLENGTSNELGGRTSTGSFFGSFTGLNPRTIYYVRAYATDRSGTVYGKDKTFTTPAPSLPTISTLEVSNISQDSAQSGGAIAEDGGAPVTARGVCWDTASTPTLEDSHTSDGGGTGSFTSSIKGLSCSTTYYVRAYATNSEGTAYGDEVSFTTVSCTPGIPGVVTTGISGITQNTAMGGGNVTDEGFSTVTARGICWSTSPSPTISDSFTIDGSGTGTYTSSLTWLSCSTTYYVRAYATNAEGTAYGSQVEFRTSPCTGDLPSVTTGTISDITANSAAGGGNVTDDGGVTVTARGVCWSKSASPTLGDSFTTDGTGTGVFTSSLTELECNTTYYVRAYATNSAGTEYGDQEEFTTDPCGVANAPTVTTSTLSNITSVSAEGGGNVTDDGGATVTSRGVCWSTSFMPTITDDHTTDGNGTGVFNSVITGLICGTTYHVRAYATNSAGTGYGDQITFPTNQCLSPPTVYTIAATDITESSAISGGNITDDGGAFVNVRGVCWSTSSNPTIEDDTTIDGTGTGSYASILTGLNGNTTYYVKAYATNSVETSYGNEINFKTPVPSSDSITDYDGNVYQTVVIGDQTWMKENLKSRHYADGTEIPMVEGTTEWEALDYTDKAYCYYDNYAPNEAAYGALYNWAAAMNGEGTSSANPSGVQGVCPDGWHLPSDNEWEELTLYLGGFFAGSALKDTGYVHWIGPNDWATNESGFTALPGGYRYYMGYFYNIRYNAYFWTSTESNYTNVWLRSLDYNNGGVFRSEYSKDTGLSVRCVRDD